MEPTYKSVGHGGCEGVEPDDLLCSRNAHDQNVLVRRAQGEINQPPSLKRERASLEGAWISFDARSERAHQTTLGEEEGGMRTL